MKYRKLRIAWSVACGVVAVLLCVLWVRSYGWCDILEHKTNSEIIHLESRKGFWIHQVLYPNIKPSAPASLRVAIINDLSLGRFFTSYPVAESYKFPGANVILGFGIFKSGATTILFAPHWFAVLLSAALTGLPWLPFSRRFSLRTLLIATTLVAMALGAIGWAVK